MSRRFKVSWFHAKTPHPLLMFSPVKYYSFFTLNFLFDFSVWKARPFAKKEANFSTFATKWKKNVFHFAFSPPNLLVCRISNSILKFSFLCCARLQLLSKFSIEQFCRVFFIYFLQKNSWSTCREFIATVTNSHKNSEGWILFLFLKIKLKPWKC